MAVLGVLLWIAPAFAANDCKIRMSADTPDPITTVLESHHVSQHGTEKYQVSNTPGTPYSDRVIVSFSKDGKMLGDYQGFPLLSRQEILRRYSTNSQQLLDKSKFEDGFMALIDLSLIQFLVDEWFYFG